MKLAALLGLLVVSTAAHGQFVYPKPEYNIHSEEVYKEDPFIVEYRKKFFSVFRGDFKTFEAAYQEIQGMVAKNPKDARALVWDGNGQTIQATLDFIKGDKADAKALAATSRKTLDAAVALRPDDPNIYMMRVATLYTQGQYFPPDWVPKSAWQELRDDCQRFLKFVGPVRVPKLSIHVRGEAYGEMGIADVRLGDTKAAKAAFEKLIELNPNTDYETRARKEIAKLQ